MKNNNNLTLTSFNDFYNKVSQLKQENKNVYNEIQDYKNQKEQYKKFLDTNIKKLDDDLDDLIKKMEKLKTKIAYLEKDKTIYEINKKLLNTLPL
jgi:phage shock protein A